MTSPAEGWTEEQIQTLTRLCEQGCTYAEIAGAMGLTLGKVASKIGRMRDALGFRSVRAMQRNHGRYMARVHTERGERLIGGAP